MSHREPAWIAALRAMEAGEEMVYERGKCYVGDRRFAARTAFLLFRGTFVSGGIVAGVNAEYYYVNESGRAALKAFDTVRP